MNIYIPYFYIIRHIHSNKLYAGSRWAKNCNPQELMQPNGYKTSSKTIHDLIERDGLESFEILRIDTYCDNLHPYDYETIFLETNNCAFSKNWINLNNNTGDLRNIVMTNYGVDNINKTEFRKQEIKSKIKANKEIGILSFGTSEFNTLYANKRVNEGTHNFLFQGEANRKIQNKLVEEGKHHFLNLQKERVKAGVHNFLGGDVQRKRIANGTHPFLNPEIPKETNRKALARPIYKLVKTLYEELNITKPKCLHRRSDSFLQEKYEELMKIKSM